MKTNIKPTPAELEHLLGLKAALCADLPHRCTRHRRLTALLRYTLATTLLLPIPLTAAVGAAVPTPYPPVCKSDSFSDDQTYETISNILHDSL